MSRSQGAGSVAGAWVRSCHPMGWRGATIVLWPPHLLRRLPRDVVMAVLLATIAYTVASWFLVWNPADGGAYYYDAAVRLTTASRFKPAITPRRTRCIATPPGSRSPGSAHPRCHRDLRPACLGPWRCSLRVASAGRCCGGPSWARWRSRIPGRPDADRDRDVRQRPSAGRDVLVWTGDGDGSRPGSAVAASIKLVPIAFALVWAGRRQWRPRFICGRTGGDSLRADAPLDLGSYPTDPGTGLLSL
jgi:hypothetical protein